MKTILVITQRAGLLAAVKTKMEARGYRVSGLENSAEAQPLVREKKVDFVLFDVETALSEGPDALNQLRGLNPAVPVVVTSLIKPVE